MLRVGIVGIGFMGWIHYLAYRNHGEVKLAAICTRDPKRLAGDWRGIQGNFGPPGEEVDLTGVAKYSELSQLLADPEIDVVDLCLPPYLHKDATIAAFKAGKHVFCEKPLALNAADCDQMVAAAASAGRQLFTGHVLPFLPEYTFVRNAVASGEFGKILGGHFKRVISDPLWLTDFYDLQKVGGPLIDLHVHDAHFIRLLFGMPTSVCSQGRVRGGTVEYCNSMFTFADPSLCVSSTSGVINQQGRPFTHAFEIHFEKATMFFEFAVLTGEVGNLVTPLTVAHADGTVTRPALPPGDPMLAAFEAEIAEVAECAAANRSSTLLGGELARDAIVMCQKQAESVVSGAPVKM